MVTSVNAVTDVTNATTTTGPVDNDNSNTFVDENVWKKWLKWYGIADSHELDRRSRTRTGHEIAFEVCIMHQHRGMVQNSIKKFNTYEQTGYIELQLRKIYRVPKHRQTRLWVGEKARIVLFSPLLERARELRFHVDTKREYILGLEIAHLDGTWPTPAYGATVGSLERYESVTEAPRRAEYWETELATAVGTVIAYVLLFTYTLRYMYINVPRSACTQKPYELHRILLFNHPENPHRQLWWTLPHYAEMGHSTSSF